MKLRASVVMLSAFTASVMAEAQNPPAPPPTAEQKDAVQRLMMKILEERKLPKVEMDKVPVREVEGRA